MSAKFQEYKNSLEVTLKDKAKPWTKYFETAEAKTGVDRVYIFLGERSLSFFHHIYLYPQRASLQMFILLVGRSSGVHRFIFSVRIWCRVNLQLDWFCVPSVHVYAGVGVSTERRRYKMAHLLGGLRGILDCGIFFRFHCWLVPIVLANEGQFINTF